MIIERILVWLLIAGILPSITAPFYTLSGNDLEVSTVIFPFTYIGPFNGLKFFFWLPLLYLYRSRQNLKLKNVSILVACLFVGTVATVVSALQCAPLPKQSFKEWAVILITSVYALSFLLMRIENQLFVAKAWVMLIFSFTFVDLLAPTVSNYLVKHLFHPMAHFDMSELGYRALASVWGRQSLAKLLCFVPWVWFCVYRKVNWVSISALILAIPLSAATTQRASVIAEVGAVLVFLGVYFGRRVFHAKILGSIFLGFIFLGASSLLIVPKRIWEPRVASFYLREIPPEKVDEVAWQSAFANRDYRLSTLKFSLGIIKENPMGNACIPLETFTAAGFPMPRSSHNLFIEQYRERGWIWGTVHLLMWILSTAATFKIKNLLDRSLRLGALTAVWITGMFDHAWQVINHALFLWIILLLPLVLLLKENKRELKQ